MYFQYRNGKLIQDNIRPDEQNIKFWEAGEYDKVFPDWKERDILYIGGAPLNYPVEDNGKMREMTTEELKEAGIIKKMTDEEKRELFKKEIDSYKAKVLERGFIFERHNQKCRDKDLALLSNAIAALEDAGGTEELSWAFSDSDIAKMSLEQLKQMRISGMNFITAVYGVEAYLKQGEIISDLTVEKFREKVNENSEVKAV
ncbi:hypothetical protein C4N20_01855 [Fusobacterium ulcerans]|uniref:DUF4376 domain-containing protein n=1 Tax=Fusobacterium ulcerans TaxID=861 RepID=A0AAX2JCE7_9FUSO|nr:hypothetical protein [Fusobacterium ulcerans]AVQ26878.1 hypothetical protein C4N20_01855 [Fusobacterium ulcerans]EFS24997.1 hypothetical protein FUAG_00512 [Fusobacterium ulcerans ATCC 49185]SQJ08824.1 Uncharacterised protein [Fusobacterium ulcerans]